MVSIGILIFPDVEELDFVGPFEVLSYANKVIPESTRVMLVAETPEPVRAFNGLRVIPDVTIADCPPLDVLIIPGGFGRRAAMKNEVLLNFIKDRQATLRFTTSVCTGSFLLAEAGLLKGKKATTYHSFFAELESYGIQVVTAKVVREGSIITAGGVSSGLELGFYLLREMFDAALAQKAADLIEYNIDVTTI